MPATLLAFGLTSDLMKKKGIPALFALFLRGKLPSQFSVVGLSRKNWSQDEVQQYIFEMLKDIEVPEGQKKLFSEKFSLVQGEADNPESFLKLKAATEDAERLYLYLCVSPDLYATIINALATHDFLDAGARVLIEKPFGTSGQDALALDALLARSLKEEQIFRIDHYLAKTGAFELALLAEDNLIGVAVYLLETEGVEDRGALYESVGALHDVGQNHMLEMLALAAGTVASRAEVLATLPILSPDLIKADTVRGQYEGYRSIEGVAPDSTTETYFKIKTAITTASGSRIFALLEAGKRMGTSRKEVVLTYANGSSRSISLESKSNEYEALFAGALMDKRDLFVSQAEVGALWRFIDPIKKEWGQGSSPLILYAPGTDSIVGA
jgi:glucose-6-phosphate 1-dehydrogenase